jgi:hypothetical protein
MRIGFADFLRIEPRETFPGSAFDLANLRRTSMDLAKSHADRFCWILRIRGAEGVLRVHARSQIARTRALFDRFSEMS